MSYTVSIHVDKKTLENIIANFDSNLADIGEKVGRELEGYAKGFAPVDTGLLRSSIHQERPGGDILAQIAVFGDECEYAIYQELGTYKMAAQPFMTPSIEQLGYLFASPELWMPLISG